MRLVPWILLGAALSRLPVAEALTILCPVDQLELGEATVLADGVLITEATHTEVDRWSGTLTLDPVGDRAELSGERLGVITLEVAR